MLGAVTISMATLDSIIREVGYKYSVEPALIKATIKVESNWDVNASRYEASMKDTSWGLMQVLLNTGRYILKNPKLTISQLIQPKMNIEAGTAYLAYQLKRYRGSILDAIAAYNAGSAKQNPITRIYSNQGYVNKVYSNYVTYRTSDIFTTIAGIPFLLAVGLIGTVMFYGNDRKST